MPVTVAGSLLRACCRRCLTAADSTSMCCWLTRICCRRRLSVVDPPVCVSVAGAPVYRKCIGCKLHWYIYVSGSLVLYALTCIWCRTLCGRYTIHVACCTPNATRCRSISEAHARSLVSVMQALNASTCCRFTGAYLLQAESICCKSRWYMLLAHQYLL